MMQQQAMMMGAGGGYGMMPGYGMQGYGMQGYGMPGMMPGNAYAMMQQQVPRPPCHIVHARHIAGKSEWGWLGCGAGGATAAAAAAAAGCDTGRSTGRGTCASHGRRAAFTRWLDLGGEKAVAWEIPQVETGYPVDGRVHGGRAAWAVHAFSWGS
jgi:hypothetical protein